MDDSEGRKERLHKFLAHAGIASRRASEEVISQGRVTVNGETVREMGCLVDPTKDDVRCDGERVQPEPPVYWLVHKPKGVVCTTKDQFGRTSVIDLVPNRSGRRLYPVGRLEEDSEGLIVVTNDGSFTQKISRMGSPLRYTYFVKLRGDFDGEKLERARQGVWLSDGRSGEMLIRVLRQGKSVSTVYATPSASQHRMLRRVFSKVGVMPEQVVRVRFGPLTNEGLKRGGCRRLTDEEVALLLDPPADAVIDFGSRGRGRRKSTKSFGAKPSGAASGPLSRGSARSGKPAGARSDEGARPVRGSKIARGPARGESARSDERGRGGRREEAAERPSKGGRKVSARSEGPRTRSDGARTRSDGARTRSDEARTRSDAPRTRSEGARARGEGARPGSARSEGPRGRAPLGSKAPRNSKAAPKGGRSGRPPRDDDSPPPRRFIGP